MRASVLTLALLALAGCGESSFTAQKGGGVVPQSGMLRWRGFEEERPCFELNCGKYRLDWHDYKEVSCKRDRISADEEIFICGPYTVKPEEDCAHGECVSIPDKIIWSNKRQRKAFDGLKVRPMRFCPVGERVPNRPAKKKKKKSTENCKD